MALWRVNILRRVKTSKGWANVALKRNVKRRIQWPSGGRFLIEWRENGKRLRASAGETPAEALEAQKRGSNSTPKTAALRSPASIQKPNRCRCRKPSRTFSKTSRRSVSRSLTKNTNTFSNYLPNTRHPSPTPGISLPRTSRSFSPGGSRRDWTLVPPSTLIA